MEGFITLIMSTGQPHGSDLHEVREYCTFLLHLHQCVSFALLHVFIVSTLGTVKLHLLLSNGICH